MRMKTLSAPASRALGLVLVVSLILAAAAHGADWPNFRGPNHNGISAESDFLTQWPADGPPVLWKASVGTGFASVSVANGRLYTVGNRDDTDTVYCFDAETGKALWQHSYASPLTPNLYEGGPSATPTVDGARVFTLSKQGDLLCLAADSGQVLWQKNIATDYNVVAPGWGFAGSPLVLGDLVVLNAGPLGLAVNKNTGAPAWASSGPGAGYSTGVPCSVNGSAAVALFLAHEVAALDPSSGHALWRHSWKTDYDLNIADPVIAGSRIFVSSDYGHGCALLNLSDGSEIWQSKALGNHISSCIVVGGYVYGVDGNVGGAQLKCLDLADGAVKWSYPGLGAGSIIVADKKIIAMSDKGVLLVADASPAGFNPISQAQILGGKCWTSPVLANGRIYCRNARGDLACLDVKKK